MKEERHSAVALAAAAPTHLTGMSASPLPIFLSLCRGESNPGFVGDQLDGQYAYEAVRRQSYTSTNAQRGMQLAIIFIIKC